MNHPVLILTKNNLELTKKCVESVIAQDTPTTIMIFDNGSTDGTLEWAKNHGHLWFVEHHNTGVSKAWNTGLGWIFESRTSDHVLVLNNDVILPPWFLSNLLSYDLPFVSGRETTVLSDIEVPTSGEIEGGPQFSAFLIRQSAWDAIGPFDANMNSWASDCDYHVRAHRKGILLQSAPVLYYHERSSTLRLAESKERRIMELQADADRMVFTEKWGIPVWSPEYVTLFSDSTFGVDRDTI